MPSFVCCWQHDIRNLDKHRRQRDTNIFRNSFSIPLILQYKREQADPVCEIGNSRNRCTFIGEYAVRLDGHSWNTFVLALYQSYGAMQLSRTNYILLISLARPLFSPVRLILDICISASSDKYYWLKRRILHFQLSEVTFFHTEGWRPEYKYKVNNNSCSESKRSGWYLINSSIN